MPQSDYVSTRMNKQRLSSKRTRQPLPPTPAVQAPAHAELVIDGTNERSYSNGDDTMTSTTSFLAPDAQYEVIQQGARYNYYSTNDDDFREAPTSYSFYTRDSADSEMSSRDYRTLRKDDEDERNNSLISSAEKLPEDDLNHEKLSSGRRTEQHQCCANNDLTSDWQNVEQLKSEDGVCPINV